MKFPPAAAAATAIAVGMLTVAATVGTASAANGFYGIDPMSLAPNQPNTDYTNDWVDGLQLKETGAHCFSTGVNLPQGAIITKVQVVFASVSGNRPYVELRRKALSNGKTANIANQILPLTNGARRQANIGASSSVATVDNAAFTYGFGICPETARNRFYGARIIYKIPGN